MRIATRASALALWQANHVASLIYSAGGGPCELVQVSTSGDRDLTSPLHSIGGKGVFVKEVQAAVLDGRADLAVHSAKDLPALTPDGLVLVAVPARGQVRDALVGSQLADLGPGARVATGSVRRRAQLAGLRPDLEFCELRGNIATRLAKAADFDAIVMAAVALERLGERPRVVDILDPGVMIPQVGQGALAIECRADDPAVRAILAQLVDPVDDRMVRAERAFLAELGGDCSLPAAAHATGRAHGEITMTGFLAAEDLATRQRLTVTGPDGLTLGASLARSLRSRLDD